MGIHAKYQEMSSNTWLKLEKKLCHSNISTIKFVNIMMRNQNYGTRRLKCLRYNTIRGSRGGWRVRCIDNPPCKNSNSLISHIKIIKNIHGVIGKFSRSAHEDGDKCR